MVEQVDFVVTQVPEGVDPLLLVEFDDRQNRVKWFKTTDLNLIDEKLIVAILATVEGHDLKFEITITYVAEGPQFDDQPADTPDPIITFSKEDIGWSYALPPLVA